MVTVPQQCEYIESHCIIQSKIVKIVNRRYVYSAPPTHMPKARAEARGRKTWVPANVGGSRLATQAMSKHFG